MEREQLLQAIQAAHRAGDVEGAKKIATLLSKQPEPQGMNTQQKMEQFGRGAVPFANEVRGAVDATLDKLGGLNSDKSWMDLQSEYSDIQDTEEANVLESNPTEANVYGGAGMATSLLIPGGGLVKASKSVRDADKVRKLNKFNFPLTEKQSSALLSTQRGGGLPKASGAAQGISRGLNKASQAMPKVPAPRLPRALTSGKEALTAAAEYGAATAIGGPPAGIGMAFLRSAAGKKTIAKLAGKINPELGEMTRQALYQSNWRFIKDHVLPRIKHLMKEVPNAP